MKAREPLAFDTKVVRTSRPLSNLGSNPGQGAGSLRCMPDNKPAVKPPNMAREAIVFWVDGWVR